MLTTEAILYYKDRPVEFVKDIIKVTPDDIQGDILTSVAQDRFLKYLAQHQRSTNCMIYYGQK